MLLSKRFLITETTSNTLQNQQLAPSLSYVTKLTIDNAKQTKQSLMLQQIKTTAIHKLQTNATTTFH
jgi:hypothetical protein